MPFPPTTPEIADYQEFTDAMRRSPDDGGCSLHELEMRDPLIQRLYEICEFDAASRIVSYAIRMCIAEEKLRRLER